MNREDIDWAILQGALITFFMCLLVGGVLISGSWYFNQEMIKKFKRNQTLFQNISNQYLAIDEEERLINEYHPKFLALFDRGILGDEHRLDWIETLRETGESIKLPALRYKISSQNAYTTELPINTGSFEIYSSEMELSLELLHEGDLFRILSDLDNIALGIYSVSGCKFLRNSDKVEADPAKANISAECNLQWFTLKKSDGSELTHL